MPDIAFVVNGKQQRVKVSAETPLLWILRENLGLTGTKYGCGMALCGACTVHVDGEAVRSCSTAISAVAGKTITTIEGLTGTVARQIQGAWLEEDVSQCGYCQPGQIMSAVALLMKNSRPTEAQVNDAMSGNLCRCGTYQRIRRAITRAADIRGERGAK